MAATLFSAVLVAGAYLLARGIESPSVAEASTETALLQAIAVKDSDGDGLPDWEEALYGTSPNIVDTFSLGMTDGQAVAKGLVVPKAIADIAVATSSPSAPDADGLPPAPAEGTLTNAFTKSFLSLYLAARQAAGGADLSEADMRNIANESIRSISSMVAIAPDYKSAKDITVSGSGRDALTAFATSAEAVFAKNRPDTSKSEVEYLKDALEKNDATAFSSIASIAKAYRDAAAGLAMLPVPQELAADDLLLVNTMIRISGITSDFARVNDDPLATIVALEQYPDAAQSLATAFLHIREIYAATGVSLSAGAPGASFVNIMKNVEDKQQARTTKTP
ncbi:hypothetical protein HY972_00845 [Candidatus Kaiserbacteria bacterium]|nr:hypothetical protein [Candidatus Kaiserbacteria bacterium]